MKKDQLKYLHGRIWIRIVLSCVLFFDVVFLLPCYVGAQKKQKSAAIRGNMRAVQIAIESFATDTGGSYPTTLNQLVSYLSGSEIKTGKPGSCEDIYFSDALSSSEKIQSMRTRDAQTISIPGAKPGQLVYSSADAGNSYAIVNVNDDGTLLSGVGGHVLVMSNQ